MVSGSRFTTWNTAVLSSRRILASARTFSSSTVSNSSGLPSGLRKVFSTMISSITPPSRAHRLLLPMCEVAPSDHSRTSLDPLPPSTGRSCTSTTFSPFRGPR
jgi:hypothetical protein